MINAQYPFSYSHFMPLASIKESKNAFLNITAQVNTNQYMTGVNLVADFKHNGKSAAYSPLYLKGQTQKGKWNALDFDVKIPKGICASDSVLVYFYHEPSDEEMMVDEFCVRIRKEK